MSTEDRKREIGKHLQMLRKRAGYKSAKAFAEAAGLNPGTYTSYEQGERSFTYETAWDMADVLRVSLDELGGRSVKKRKYTDERQERMNDAFEYLDDEQKEFAAGSIEGMAASQARKKACVPRVKNNDLSA